MFGVGPLDELDDAIAKLRVDEGDVDLVGMRRAMDRLEAEWVRRVRHFDRSGVPQAEGRSPASWLARECRLSWGAARATVELGRTLEVMPVVADAFADGEISKAHAEAITSVRTTARAEALTEVEAPLVDAARSLAPRALRRVVRYACDAIDGDGGARAAEAQHERRFLHVSRTIDGMVALNGLLDGDTGESVLRAINEGVRRDPACPGDQPRTRAQRRADALGHLCRRSLRETEPTSTRHVPQLALTTDLQVIEDRAGTNGPNLVAAIRAEAANHAHLSVETLRRIACDAGISRIITTGRSEPLDVGRSTRVISPALWKALVARDGGCVHPTCDKPPEMCEAHHGQHWIDGGPTSIHNLELRCYRHHRDKHERQRARGT